MSWSDAAGLVPATVLDRLSPEVVAIFSVSDDASDTAACSSRYGIDLADCANTLILRFTKGGIAQHAAVVTLASRRLDANGLVRSFLAAQKVTFAKPDDVAAMTRMEFGGVTAFGLPADWPVLVDSAVMGRRQIVMGAGVRAAKLLLEPEWLRSIPTARVGDLTRDSPDPQN
jgi:prolyl-tRNA editing enzyme YbaK/EbsC (Cys-tRNA(Pro) deacylase)